MVIDALSEDEVYRVHCDASVSGNVTNETDARL